MIFRRRQDEMEGFRRMREALRQQHDPQDHALIDEQYGAYEDDEEATLVEGEPALAEEDELTEAEAEADEAEAAYGASAEPAPPAAAPAAPAFLSESAPRPAPGGPSMTTIGADTTWSGTMRSESNVYLEGRVEGTIEVRDTIFIAERATIDARLKAQSVVVSGQLNGHVDCEGRLEITPTGRVNGEVVTGSLVVHEGAVVDGKVQMRSSVTPQGSR